MCFEFISFSSFVCRPAGFLFRRSANSLPKLICSRNAKFARGAGARAAAKCYNGRMANLFNTYETATRRSFIAGGAAFGAAWAGGSRACATKKQSGVSFSSDLLVLS
jgi:hypothetical protein